MSVFLKPGQVKIKDENGDYNGINVVALESTEEYLTEIETKGTQIKAQIEAKGAATKASIPEDYTALSEEVSELNERLDNEGLSEDAKVALLNCFAHVAWIDEHGQDYYDALEDALYPETGLVRIEAVFNQGANLFYEDTPLNDLKAYLTVTGYYNDGSSMVITDYTLSGTLEDGTSTITVMKDTKTTTFDVVVTGYPVLPVYVGKGIDWDTTAQILDQANRCISEKVPFVNEIPITVQWIDKPSPYQYALKNIKTNDIVDGYGVSYDPDEKDRPSGSPQGWIRTDRQNTAYKLIDEQDTLVNYADSSGYCRIVFAPAPSISADLPDVLPSGYIVITGTKYKIQCVTE